MAEIEKTSGGRIPDYISQGWVKEDRQIAEAFAAMEKAEAGLFPKLDSGKFNDPKFGVLIIFGTGGESNVPYKGWEEFFNKPEGYNLKE